MSLNCSFFRLICHDALQNLLATSKSQSKSLLVFKPCIAWDVMQTDCILLISVLNACMNCNLVPPTQRSISRICQELAELGWISWNQCSVLPLEKSMVHQELQGDELCGPGLLWRDSPAWSRAAGTRPHLHCLCPLGRRDVALGGASGALSVQRILSSLGSSRAGCTPHWEWQTDGPWVSRCHLLLLLGCSSQAWLGVMENTWLL